MFNEINKEIEETIIGTAITFEGAFDKLVDHYKIDNPNYFTDIICKCIFSICLKCKESNIPVNLKTIDNVGSKMKFNFNVASVAAILSTKVSTDAHFEYNVFMFKELILKNYWINVSNKIKNTQLESIDVFDLSSDLITGYESLENKLMPERKSESVDDIKKQRENYLSGKLVFVPYPVNEFNEFTGGMIPPEFTIMAARPSIGKTTVAMAWAIHASFRLGFRGLFVSLEMSRKQLIDKIAASYIGINYKSIRNYSMSNEDFEKYLKVFKEIQDSKKLRFLENKQGNTVSKIKKAIDEYKPDYVIIDYIQLVNSESSNKSKSNREQEVSEISRALKQICLDYNIPIIALAQLSRNVEKRPDNRPMLSDLRESGSLEQDADNVFFLYRYAYYMVQKGEFVNDHEHGNLDLIIAKGRNIGTGNFKMYLEFLKFKLTSGFKE